MLGAAMIEAIRNLDPAQQRQLIRLLDRRVDLDDIEDADVLLQLTSVLRRVLDVPEKGDLPEYLRRRLVDAAKTQFELVEGAELDTRTDLEVAAVLTDFVLEAAERLAADSERRAEFETFLRTKDREDRRRLLVQSQRFAALVADSAFDRQAAERRAHEVGQRRPGPREESAHTLAAQEVLAGLSGAKKRGRGKAATAGLAAQAAATSAAAAAVAPAAAVPLGVLAGGLYMAGRGKRDLAKVVSEEDKKTRQQRARRSRLVQSVITLAAFMVVTCTADGA